MFVSSKYLKILPKIKKPLGSYVMVSYSNGLGKISGQFPSDEDNKFITGSLGKEVSIERGEKASISVALNILTNIYQINKEVEDLQLIHIDCYIQSNLNDQKLINCIDTLSFILKDALGHSGNHSRSLVIVNDLPFNTLMEVVTTFSYKTKE